MSSPHTSMSEPVSVPFHAIMSPSYSESRISDDICMIYAALTNRCYFVSNDHMSENVSMLSPHNSRLFARWQAARQITIDRRNQCLLVSGLSLSLFPLSLSVPLPPSPPPPPPPHHPFIPQNQFFFATPCCLNETLGCEWQWLQPSSSSMMARSQAILGQIPTQYTV